MEQRMVPLLRQVELTRTGGLSPLSPSKRRERRKAQPVVDAMLRRDGWQCILRFHRSIAGDCMGPSTPHHLRKQNKRGGWELDNLVTLCARHNDWVENDEPDLAHELGLVVRNGESVYAAWDRMVAAGLPVTHPVQDACCDLPDGECEHGRDAS